MKPIGQFILIRMHRKKKEGSIELPSTATDSMKGIVLELGTPVKDAKKNNIISLVEVGETVGFDPRMLTPVDWEGTRDDRYIIHQDDLLYKHEDGIEEILKSGNSKTYHHDSKKLIDSATL